MHYIECNEISKQTELKSCPGHQATECSTSSTFAIVMMKLLHQLRFRSQDNHATNHTRCTIRSKAEQSAKAYRGQPKRSHIALNCVHNKAFRATYCSQEKQGKKHPVNAYGGSTNWRHGRRGTRMRTEVLVAYVWARCSVSAET
jgi:hypothetical protein